MKRKEYEKPTMTVVELRNTGMLMTSLTSTSVNATMDDEWDEEDIDAPAATRVLTTKN